VSPDVQQNGFVRAVVAPVGAVAPESSMSIGSQI
jgi:hypothetical protein